MKIQLKKIDAYDVNLGAMRIGGIMKSALGWWVFAIGQEGDLYGLGTFRSKTIARRMIEDWHSEDATVYNPGKSMAQVMREWDEMPDAKPHSCITQNALQSDIDKALAKLDERDRKFDRDVARAQANLREGKP